MPRKYQPYSYVLFGGVKVNKKYGLDFRKHALGTGKYFAFGSLYMHFYKIGRSVTFYIHEVV